MNSRLDITIAIPTKNEEKNLPGCLAAIGDDFAARVVVIDSGSTDATTEIAMLYGVEVIDFKWNGNFPKKRNWYLREFTPVTKWVLFLDADEYITPEFKVEVREAIANEDFVGFWLNYTIYFMGDTLKWGYPLKKLALFQIGKGEYERIDEENWSHLDMEIHEHPILAGPTGKIRSKIDHQDFRGISHYVKKHDDYASWEALRYLKRENSPENRKQLTFKQSIKYKLVDTPFVGIIYFLGNYILLGGCLDGSRGLAFSILKASYFVQVYCKIREFRKKLETRSV